MDLFTGFGIIRIAPAARQVMEDQLNGFDRETIGIIGCHNGNIRFNGMGQHIHPGIRRNGFGHGGDKLGVNDRSIHNRPADI